MTSPIEPASDDLQFETAEPAAAAVPPQGCARCQRPLPGEYYAIGKHMICPDCHAELAGPAAGNSAARLGKALLFGIGGGILGSLIWFGVRRVSGYEIGLIAVLVGFLVGKAVRKGSGDVGGTAYQIMAVLITYGGVAMSFVLEILFDFFTHSGAMASSSLTPSFSNLIKVLIVAVPISFILPFEGGTTNALGLLIIGFALWEAWKLNKPRALAITGPYKIAAAPPLIGTKNAGQTGEIV